jgi:mono/diheme cytochrome c family protein
MSFKRKLPILLLAAGLIGCVTALYLPTQGDADAAGVSLASLQQGRTLYINRCASCHNLYQPSAYTHADWAPILDRMQKPAKITDDEKRTIAKYLEVGAKR